VLEGLGLLANIIILIVALVALDRASDLTITQSINVASVTGLGKTTVGLILVAFSTSLPELFVAIFPVLNPENVGVSIGNVLGSNIVNICLILGVCFLLISLNYPEKSRVLPKMAKAELGSLYFGLFISFDCSVGSDLHRVCKSIHRSHTFSNLHLLYVPAFKGSNSC